MFEERREHASTSETLTRAFALDFSVARWAFLLKHHRFFGGNNPKGWDFLGQGNPGLGLNGMDEHLRGVNADAKLAMETLLEQFPRLVPGEWPIHTGLVLIVEPFHHVMAVHLIYSS